MELTFNKGENRFMGPLNNKRYNIFMYHQKFASRRQDKQALSKVYARKFAMVWLRRALKYY